MLQILGIIFLVLIALPLLPILIPLAIVAGVLWLAIMLLIAYPAPVLTIIAFLIFWNMRLPMLSNFKWAHPLKIKEDNKEDTK